MFTPMNLQHGGAGSISMLSRPVLLANSTPAHGCSHTLPTSAAATHTRAAQAVQAAAGVTPAGKRGRPQTKQTVQAHERKIMRPWAPSAPYSVPSTRATTMRK